jgi:hypothetical protein
MSRAGSYSSEMISQPGLPLMLCLETPLRFFVGSSWMA